ncbi:hypothetical protein MTR67_006846 [Solanum verrucosum]|uniref:Uncharacterized protein n=1 Tax=Solanum verrucosum TaxID=315347 RepID=A0AAF0TC73_SOLVR|nr:hypothetical protein MTR67_006846 [Solanum verrucosum]
MENYHEPKDNMSKMMSQLDLLSKHVMGSGLKSVNALGKSSGKCSEDAKFEVLYNKEVRFLGNQMEGSHPNYLRVDENQGWNKERGNGWRDRGGNWTEREFEKDRYVHLMITPN